MCIEKIRKVKKIEYASISYPNFSIEAKAIDKRNVEIYVTFNYEFLFMGYFEKYEDEDIVYFLNDAIKNKYFWKEIDKVLTHYLENDFNYNTKIIENIKKYISVLDFDIDYADDFVEENNERKKDILTIQNAMFNEHRVWKYEEEFRFILENKDKYVILDIETTGLSFSKDRVIELGIIDLDGNVLFDDLIYTDVPISQEAYKIHHIKQEDLKGKPTIEDLRSTLDSVLKAKIVIGYNVQFDMNMLDVSGYKDILYNNSYCLMNAYMNYRNASFFYSLQGALMSEGINIKQNHRAVDDAFCCLNLIKKIASKSRPGEVYE